MPGGGVAGAAGTEPAEELALLLERMGVPGTASGEAQTDDPTGGL